LPAPGSELVELLVVVVPLVVVLVLVVDVVVEVVEVVDTAAAGAWLVDVTDPHAEQTSAIRSESPARVDWAGLGRVGKRISED
jgi:hypothetical protein